MKDFYFIIFRKRERYEQIFQAAGLNMPTSTKVNYNYDPRAFLQ